MLQGIFKDKSEYPTLTRMSYCQCRLKLVFLSIFKKFNWTHVALIQDRSDLFSLTVGEYFDYDVCLYLTINNNDWLTLNSNLRKFKHRLKISRKILK